MNTGTESPNRRAFVKGLAVGAGGYSFGVSFIHPEEAMGNLLKLTWKKSEWILFRIMLPVD